MTRAGNATCERVNVASCDLLRQVVTAKLPAPWVYTTLCAPSDTRLARPPFLTGLPISSDIEPIGTATGNELTLYQLACSCSASISLTKDSAAVPPAVRLDR